MLVDLTATGGMDPAAVLSHTEPLSDIVKAYQTFDRRQPGWIKVAIREKRHVQHFQHAISYLSSVA
jgi:threonine dehydrogenase-like Zn-dependent dehydrogenase